MQVAAQIMAVCRLTQHAYNLMYFPRNAMMGVAVGVLLAMLTSPATNSVSVAHELSAFKRCASIASSTERLGCYDALVSRSQVVKPSPRSVSGGDWHFSTSISQMDDTKTAVVFTKAVKQVGRGLRRGLPTLWIRCKEGKIGAYINFGFFIGTDTIQVEYRYDREKLRRRDWSISTDHQAIFFPGGSDNQIAFVKKIRMTNKLNVRLTPYGENPVLAEFRTVGLSTVLHHIENACKNIGYLGSDNNREVSQKWQGEADIVKRQIEQNRYDMDEVRKYMSKNLGFDEIDLHHWRKYASAPKKRDVMIAQGFLKIRNFYLGRVDGNYSDELGAAIEAWKSSQNLEYNPEFDSQTIIYMYELHKNRF